MAPFAQPTPRFRCAGTALAHVHRHRCSGQRLRPAFAPAVEGVNPLGDPACSVAASAANAATTNSVDRLTRRPTPSA